MRISDWSSDVCSSDLAFALTYVMTRKLMPTETPLGILFYMSAVQLALAVVPSVLDWRPIPLQALHWIAVVGLASLVTHYCLARAMKLADATIVVPLDFRLDERRVGKECGRRFN